MKLFYLKVLNKFNSGYEGAILKQPCQLNRLKAGINQAQGPVAFLSFASRKDAEAAKEKFHGFQIDPHLENMTLKIEFAKVNYIIF